jgi:hypothetical protein
VTGHGIEHEALEAELAAFTGRERALVYSTGYMANLGVIGALADQTSLLVADKLNHASLIDGCRATGDSGPDHQGGLDCGHGCSDQRTAMGLTGEPTAPVIGRGAATSRNS